MKIWSLKPLFVWKGTVPKINVNSDDGKKTLFSKDVNGVDRILYQGEALQPGKTYKLEIFGTNDKSHSIFSIPFQIMAAPEREEIATKLKDLEAMLKAKKANKEMIALHRANFFADRELWADVLQSALSVKNPSSSELKKFIQELPMACRVIN